eukprot:4125483-Pyramimonas_sp.AAC.2
MSSRLDSLMRGYRPTALVGIVFHMNFVFGSVSGPPLDALLDAGHCHSSPVGGRVRSGIRRTSPPRWSPWHRCRARPAAPLG